MIIVALSTITKLRNQPKCASMDKRIKKCDPQWNRDTMEYCPAMRNKEILPFVTTWMEVEGIILSEISQREKGKHCMLSLIFKKVVRSIETKSRKVVVRTWSSGHRKSLVKEYKLSAVT